MFNGKLKFNSIQSWLKYEHFIPYYFQNITFQNSIWANWSIHHPLGNLPSWLKPTAGSQFCLKSSKFSSGSMLFLSLDKDVSSFYKLPRQLLTSDYRESASNCQNNTNQRILKEMEMTAVHLGHDQKHSYFYFSWYKCSCVYWQPYLLFIDGSLLSAFLPPCFMFKALSLNWFFPSFSIYYAKNIHTSPSKLYVTLVSACLDTFPFLYILWVQSGPLWNSDLYFFNRQKTLLIDF